MGKVSQFGSDSVSAAVNGWKLFTECMNDFSVLLFTLRYCCSNVLPVCSGQELSLSLGDTCPSLVSQPAQQDSTLTSSKFRIWWTFC